MEAKYFNKLESGKIYSLIKTNPMESIEAYEEYLERYPRDYYTYLAYVYALNILSKTKKATEVLEETIEQSSKDKNFTNDLERFKTFKRIAPMRKLEILANEEKYAEAYELALNIPKNYSLENFLLYCETKLGIVNDFERDNTRYLFRQILQYQESDFENHIRKHLSDCNEDPEEALFGTDFPISEVIREIKKYIPSDKKLFYGLLTNNYTFKYDGCGRSNNSLQDYFTVTSFHNSDDLITMFPAHHCENLPYIDLNYMIENVEKPKIKVMSQIDKFNQRYRRNK